MTRRLAAQRRSTAGSPELQRERVVGKILSHKNGACTLWGSTPKEQVTALAHRANLAADGYKCILREHDGDARASTVGPCKIICRH